MARRPTYSFERAQRDRAKVAKREAKRAAREARRRGAPTEDAEGSGEPSGSSSGGGGSAPETPGGGPPPGGDARTG